MYLSDKFYDIHGNEVLLETVCIKEPLWAASVIRYLCNQVDKQTKKRIYLCINHIIKQYTVELN